MAKRFLKPPKTHKQTHLKFQNLAIKSKFKGAQSCLFTNQFTKNCEGWELCNKF